MEFGGEEEEIELSLGLAIGGGCKKRLRLEDRVCEVPENGEAGGKEGEQEQVDLVKRREMQAQRRQEARRKREEKKHMKRGGLKVVRNSSMNQKVDDGVIVEESDEAERALKREKIESGLQPQATKSEGVEGADQSCSNASEFITSEQAAPASAFAFPIYAYPSFQYVPFANGFAFPCIAPSVYRAEFDGTNKSAPPQTVSFRPFVGGKKSNDVNLRGAAATVNGRNCEGNVKDLSNGSLCCCSSAISENRSISSQDGSSSDSGSHLSCPKSGKTELHSSSGSDLPGTSKRKALSNPSTTTDAEKANNAPPATAFQPTPAKVSKQDTSVVEQKPAKIPILRSTSLPQPKTPITKDNKVVDSNNPRKPPRPQPVDNQKTNSPLSQMPCVSTTGNGPDGKTITGFLYRYNTTAEVSIVCVCHGESFSPAEFVKHAGGIDVSHPLRHITVVPSAF